MTRLPKGALGFLTLFVVLVTSGVVYSASDQDSGGTGPAPDTNFPDPVIGVLTKPLEVPGTSLSLRPPKEGFVAPAVNGVEAVEIAEGEFSAEAFPDGVIASLAWDEGSSRLIWAVAFPGICVPDAGPGGVEHDPCGSNELTVIIDASTGHVDGMVSFRKV